MIERTEQPGSGRRSSRPSLPHQAAPIDRAGGQHGPQADSGLSADLWFDRLSDHILTTVPVPPKAFGI